MGATQFAQVPILNASQLVARWKLETPPALVSETQQLPIDGLGAGVYLIEATDGTYKAYTVAMVTSIAVVERTENGQADLYVADRKTGAPVEKADVALWADGKMQSKGATNGDGTSLTMTPRGATAVGPGRGARKRLDPGAAWSRCGTGDAVELWLRAAESTTDAGVYLHGPAGVSAGTYGAHQGSCAHEERRHAAVAARVDADVAGDRQQQQGRVYEEPCISRRMDR